MLNNVLKAFARAYVAAAANIIAAAGGPGITAPRSTPEKKRP